MTENDKLKAHVFICTNLKTKGESCGAKNAQILRDNVKLICKNNKTAFDKVRINICGCLGKCEEGIAAVIYPQSIWLKNLKENDEKIILEKLSEVLR